MAARRAIRFLDILPLVALVASVPAAAQHAGSESASDSAAQGPVAAAQPWHDSDLPPAARAEALLAAMTHDEKLQLVYSYFPPFAQGPLAADMFPSAGYVPGIARLGLPPLRETDASLGVANQVEQRRGDVATALPSGLALAASFSPEIAHAGGAMIGAEARAKRFNVMLAGGVNLTRDPWAGRNFEYLGEDPLLAGRLAGASIAGVQSNHIVSTVKHFALNAQETGRFVMDARIGEAALRESDLLAFQIAIEDGAPGSVMCAYNSVNGDFACENDFLLNDVLKRDWGYRGWVMSDWGAMHSTVKAARDGLDQQSGKELDTAPFFVTPLRTAIAAGTLPGHRLDDMVRRVLRGVIAAGVLDAPVVTAPQPIDYAANAEVAQRAAEAGIVLLKNDGGLLPLARTARRIAVIGGHADVGVLSGGGSSQVRSVGGAPVEVPLEYGAAASFARVTYHASSPLAALRNAAPDAEIRFVDGSDRVAAAAAARDADVAILFATQWTTEAQDAPDLSLPDDQDALIDAVAGAQARTVVVLETGGPVLMPWIDAVPAVVQAWYPGQRGGEAIAAILTGAVNPSGRLPITFPRSADQAPRATVPGMDVLHRQTREQQSDARGLPAFAVDYVEGSDVGYRWYAREGHAPLFSFGHGLSYTDFAYSDLSVTGGDTITARFTVTNTGRRAGAAVPQLYVAPADGSYTARLAGFERVTLAPGERRTVTLTAEPRIVARYDPQLPGWHVAPGTYRVRVAKDAASNELAADVVLQERFLAP